MLTIGELAGFCGVTTRTVRYYQAQGLMPEPERDHAGYRRYRAVDVVRLSRIVALASAGVPLARVDGLLEADDDTLRAAVAEIDADVRAEIARLKRLRTTLADLASTDRLALPDSLASIIERLRASDADRDRVDLWRDAWILVHAVLPDHLQVWLEDSAYADPRYVTLLERMLVLADVDPHDPRVDALADDSIAWAVQAADDGSMTWETTIDDERAIELMNEQWVTTPAWDRLGALVAEGVTAHGLSLPASAPEPPR